MRRTAIALLALTLSAALPVAALSIGGAPAASQELGAANRLFLDATALYEQAEASGDADRRAELFAETRRLLERIRAEYPDSHLALLLALGQPVGKLSLPLVEASTELARLRSVDVDQVLAELEQSRDAVQALRSQSQSQRAALSAESTRITGLLVEQNRLQTLLAQRQTSAAPDAELARQLDAAKAETEALKQQKASITALLTSEREKAAGLEARIASLGAAGAAGVAGAAGAAGASTLAATGSAAAESKPEAAQAAAPAGAAPAPAVSTEEVAAAIKEALRLGTERVVAQVGQTDGYNADPSIHIPLPPDLAQVGQMLGAMGLSGLTADVELRMNRAAEAAAPEAAAIFGEAIASMKVEDIQGIMNGPDDAATQYFQGAMSQPLAEALRPVIDRTLAEAGAIQAYDDMLGKYKAIPLVPDIKADLSAHTTQAAMQGLFLYLAREEAEIRNDAAMRTTELLKKVFGT